MRVALFNTNPDWGGGERWFFDASEALRDRGHDVVCVGRPGTPLFERWAARAVTAEAAFSVEAGGPLPDVVVGNSGREFRSAVRLLPSGARTRLVLRRGIDRPLRDNWVRRRTWRRLSGILVNSLATGRTVQDSLPWFPSDRIRHIYNPVRLLPAPRVDGGDVLRLGVAARLVRQKGIDVLLDALTMLGIDRPWTLHVAGEGAARGELIAQVERSDLQRRVRFLGHVDDMPGFYAKLDVLVVPSRYEGFGFVAVEGALAGLPVVATRVSSLPEVVLDGETGLLVAPDEPGEVAAALDRLAADPALAERLGSTGRARALRDFDPGPIYDQLEAFLAEAIDWPEVGG